MVEAEKIRTEVPKQREMLPYLLYKLKKKSLKFHILWSAFKLTLFIWIISILFRFLIWGSIFLALFLLLFNPFSDFITRNNPYFLLEKISVTEIDSKDPNSWYNRGLAYLKLGRLDEALIDFNRSTRLDSTIPNVWAYKAVCLFNQKNYEESLNAINRTIELIPTDTYYLAIKYNILIKLDRKEEAQKIKIELEELKEVNNSKEKK